MKIEIETMNAWKRWAMAAGFGIATTLALYSAKGEERTSKPARDLSYLTNHIEIINLSLKYFQAVHPEVKAPENNLVYGVIGTESGSPKHRKNDFVYDPMSISHQGDSALQVLAGKKDCSWLIGDFTCLRDNKNSVRTNGQWNYQGTGMNADESVFGGIGWLYHNAAIYENKTFESGEVKTYAIQKGDSFAKVAKRLHTTSDTLVKYNLGVKPEKLQIGQKVNYRESITKATIVGWRPWTNAVERYNGSGDTNYLSKVLDIKKELDK